MHLLYLEPNIGGHHPDYIRNFTSYWNKHKIKHKITFILNQEFAIVHPNELKFISSSNQIGKTIFIKFLDKKEAYKCSSYSLILRSFALWQAMRKYLKLCNAHHGIFSGLDHLQLALALRLPFPDKTTVSGILVRPSMHFQTIFKYMPSLSEFLKIKRKKLFHLAMLYHPRLKAIFTFDPYFEKYMRNNFKKGYKITWIPDPNLFPILPNIFKKEFSWISQIPKNRELFILFGALSKRKGILKTLDALSLMESKVASKIAVVFAGKVEKRIRSTFIKMYNYVSNKQRDLWMHLEDRYLESDEIVVLIQRCKTVLAPYQHWDGPSGILPWAAGAGKPVIIQNFGLLGALTKDYKLGIAIDVTNPQSLADAIKTCVYKKPSEIFNINVARKFAENLAPFKFCGGIINRIIA